MEGKHHCWPGICFCERPTLPPVLFQSENRGSIFGPEKSESKNRQFWLFQRLQRTGGFLEKNQQGYKSGSFIIIFFPFFEGHGHIPEPV
jgi:hypothetical protein